MLCCDVNIGKRLTPQRRSSLVLTSVDFWCFSFAQFNETLNVVVFPVTLLNSEPAPTVTAMSTFQTPTQMHNQKLFTNLLQAVASSFVDITASSCDISVQTRGVNCISHKTSFVSVDSQIFERARLVSKIWHQSPPYCKDKRPWEQNLAESHLGRLLSLATKFRITKKNSSIS